MKWKKKGCIFKANDEFGWIKSHAQVPTVLVREDVIRVYFSPRPQPGLSCIAMMDLNIDNPSEVLKIYDKPVLEHGLIGEFDEHGVMPQWVIEVQDKIYLFYAGWSRRDSIPYSNWMGVAVSDDGGLSFRKCYKGPILDRTRDEVLSGTELFGIKKDQLWYGYYASGTYWKKNKDGGFDSAYEIVSTKSKDLVNWENRNGKPIFPTKKPTEANTCPTVIKIGDKYHMWFCYRDIEDYHDGIGSYNIGYAWSKDLEEWHREDENAGIKKSEYGWDSSMIAYPYVVRVKDKYYLFYCGNGFGKEGFGYAELDLEKN